MAILVLTILINRSYLQLMALKPGIYRVTASAEGYLSICTVFLDTSGYPTSAPQYSNSSKYTTYAQTNKKFGHSLRFFGRVHGRIKILMDSHPYGYEIFIFTLVAPHEEA